MATNLYIEVANQKGVNSPTDSNPIVPPDLSPPATYQFNLYYLDFGNPDTYHRFQTAKMEINIRQNGPPTSGTFTLSFLGYTTAPIDINATRETVLDAFTALRSVGPGNAQISGDNVGGWTIEFIGTRAGLAQSAISCNASACLPAGVAIVKQVQTGGGSNNLNSRQLILISQDRVATTNLFTELTAGSLWGWATSSGLSTSGISQSFWNQPAYDVILEVKLYIAGARTGTDGITTQLAQRTGADGVIGDDGRGRTGTDGVIPNSPGRSGTGYRFLDSVTINSRDSIIAQGIEEGNTFNGTPFTLDDVGRTITEAAGKIPAGTTITQVVISGSPSSPINYCKLSQSFAPVRLPRSGGVLITFNWTTGDKVSNQFQSASANFTQADVGHVITDTGGLIPPGTTILQVLNSTTVILSNLPSALGSGISWTIVAQVSNKFTSASAAFTALDVGRSITGPNFPANTTISTFIDSQNVTVSQTPTATGSGLSWTLPAVMSSVYQSATANFVQADVGKILSSDNVPSNTTIVSVTDSTHCVLSQIPTAAGTGENWQILSTLPGSSAPPTITTKQVGTSSVPAIQRIAFAEIPSYGSFLLTLNGVTTAPIPAPVDILALQSALNLAFPNQGQFSISAAAKCVFDITFGVNGAQNLFTADDTNVVYDNAVLKLVLVPGTGIKPTAPPVPDITILYDGDFTRAYTIGKPRVTNLSDGTNAIEVRQRYMQLSANWRKMALNSGGGPFGTYLIGEDSMEDVGGGVIAWDRVWASLPGSRREIHSFARPAIGVGRQYTNGQLVDIQLFSLSPNDWMNVDFTYSLGHPTGVPGNSPVASVIHYPAGIQQLFWLNGFNTNTGTLYRQGYVWAWSKRRWKGEIWELQTWRE